MKIILLNGPPGCGKDFGGRKLMDALAKSVTVKFAKELKERTHALYRLVDADGMPRPHDWFEAVKDDPLHQFHGKTPRECYIAVSENLIKPMHGTLIFGTWLVDAIEAAPMYDTFIVTDSGFRHEAIALMDRFGVDNCLLVRIHRDGHNFASDSRSYLDLADIGVQCKDITNNGTADFPKELIRVVST